MRGFRFFLICLLAGCQPAPPPAAPSPAPEGAWISLFNGRDLANWTPKFQGSPLGENVLNTFRVEDGLLTVSYAQYDTFGDRLGHLYYTPRTFSHYWLRAEYRFIGRQVPGAPDWGWRNNGIMLHAQPPVTMTLDQDFPISFETRLRGGRMWGDRSTAGACMLGITVLFEHARTTDRCIESISATYRGDQWVTVEVEVRGSEMVRHYVNGRLVLEVNDLRLDQPQPWSPGPELASGYIAIQAETHPTQFRRIEVLDLAPAVTPAPAR